MTISVFYYEPEPQGGYAPDAQVAYWFDADSVTLKRADDPIVLGWIGAGNTIAAYQTPPAPPSNSEIDSKALNDALTAPGSVVRALGLVMLAEFNKLRVKNGDAAYTLAQFKAALLAQMR